MNNLEFIRIFNFFLTNSSLIMVVHLYCILKKLRKMSRVPHIDSDPGSITMLSWPNPYYCRRSRGSASTARNPLPPPATWSSTSPHMAWAKFTRWVVDWWPVCGLFTRWVLDWWPVCGLFTRWVLDWWTIVFISGSTSFFRPHPGASPILYLHKYRTLSETFYLTISNWQH